MAKEEEGRAACPSSKAFRRWWWAWGWTWHQGLRSLSCFGALTVSSWGVHRNFDLLYNLLSYNYRFGKILVWWCITFPCCVLYCRSYIPIMLIGNLKVHGIIFFLFANQTVLIQLKWFSISPFKCFVYVILFCSPPCPFLFVNGLHLVVASH